MYYKHIAPEYTNRTYQENICTVLACLFTKARNCDYQATLGFVYIVLIMYSGRH